MSTILLLSNGAKVIAGAYPINTRASHLYDVSVYVNLCTSDECDSLGWYETSVSEDSTTPITFIRLPLTRQRAQSHPPEILHRVTEVINHLRDGKSCYIHDAENGVRLQIFLETLSNALGPNTTTRAML
jgi:hypothetical protein